MGLKETVRELLDGNNADTTRWLLVVLGVLILLRLRLVLFAAALPVVAYWHYSNQNAAEEEPEPTNDSSQRHQREQPGEGDLDDLDEPWPPVDEDDADFSRGASGNSNRVKTNGSDPYDQEFWGSSAAQGRTAPKMDRPWTKSPSNSPANLPSSKDGPDDDFDLSSAGAAPRKNNDVDKPWHMEGGKDEGLDFDLPSLPSKKPDTINNFGLGDDDDMDFLGGLKGPGDGLGLSFDFLGGGDDMDFMGGGGRGKGKGKGKNKDGKGKDGPREPDPKQLFVANLGDATEDEIRSIFEDIGEVNRVKILTNEDGSSKGVCFVTFRTEDQAQQALTLHGSSHDGRNLVVRLAHGGNKGEKGEKGDRGRGKGGVGRDRDGPVDLGGSERFGAAFGDRQDRDRDMPSKGKSKGKSGGARRGPSEIDELLEDTFADSEGPVRPGDFDFAARRFLTELRTRDRNDGTSQFQDAMDMIMKYTGSKDRSSVRKWPAYIFTLLTKFDEPLANELRERDAERRRQKGGGGFGNRERDD